ncbi:DUF3800 domain-containing protein [Bradyrhizobium sp. INPA01-394B]|uniref:DUF3800 domain-containing protein n=1 Tax=Bradyrhizobium campsiandrae TaxID=1729892 RepID=A0ABR7U9G2_9BRAD|nr:hypothetical protein [Bradyrhizobium campsiandrae]MBC9876376.1 DUF3800 domain-containing protein [Bradyrhizobium campsiandrae]MBC9980099.1 hypothetical protein [Bradyrhizobium campsiandrae]
MGALISANFDDSRSGDDVWVVAGYAGYANQWDYFEELWDVALKKHDVPYFHMREMADETGPFAKWLPAKDHQKEVIAFYTDLAQATRKSHLRMVASGVWMPDLEKFNAMHGLSLEAYPLAAYACLVQISQEYHDAPATAVFDRVEKVDDKLSKARVYAKSDPRFYPAGPCDSVASRPIPKGITFRNVPALQAADFICWEVRKALFGMKDWQLLPDKPQGDRALQWQHYLEHKRNVTGKSEVIRRSLGALIRDMPVHSVVWDWDQLDSMHASRRGVWTLEEAASAVQRG